MPPHEKMVVPFVVTRINRSSSLPNCCTPGLVHRRGRRPKRRADRIKICGRRFVGDATLGVHIFFRASMAEERMTTEDMQQIFYAIESYQG
jgi:hypothetical protein